LIMAELSSEKVRTCSVFMFLISFTTTHMRILSGLNVLDLIRSKVWEVEIKWQPTHVSWSGRASLPRSDHTSRRTTSDRSLERFHRRWRFYCLLRNSNVPLTQRSSMKADNHTAVDNCSGDSCRTLQARPGLSQNGTA
jgi:hypothetical protein